MSFRHYILLFMRTVHCIRVGKIRSTFLFFAFLLYTRIVSAQDSIFTHSPEPLLVRVLEISGTEVSYKNFYNPDGVIRKISNDKVVKIIYENGRMESRFQLMQKTNGNVPRSELFVVEGKHIALNNKDIAHKEAFKFLLKRDPQINSEELNGALVDAESKKNGQIAFNVIAPASVVAGIYFARQHRYNDPTEKLKAKAYFISGLSICVTSIITAQIYKSIKNKNIRKAALLYNNEIY